MDHSRLGWKQKKTTVPRKPVARFPSRFITRFPERAVVKYPERNVVKFLKKPATRFQNKTANKFSRHTRVQVRKIPKQTRVPVCETDVHRCCEKFSNIFPFSHEEQKCRLGPKKIIELEMKTRPKTTKKYNHTKDCKEQIRKICDQGTIRKRKGMKLMKKSIKLEMKTRSKKAKKYNYTKDCEKQPEEI